ncbi:nucleotide sugar dehydrogenase [Sulfitobacter sp.]|uniref:nucleotide sugar dehydrogenase n=1 Tax=Sulfitobacter sp. TaxID=1903071 RepID=UPI003EF1B035
MKIMILGLGYVGFTAACCLAHEGHSVVGIDVSEKKVRGILDGHSPIIEPGVDAMLTDGLAQGRISVAASIGSHLEDCDVAIVCVGTPSGVDGAHDMGFIADVSRQIAQAVMKSDRDVPLTVVYRSTIRPGTTEELINPIFKSVLGARAEELIDLVYNPEFLREGSAVQDYFTPPKIVIGTRDGTPNAHMEAVNANIKATCFIVGYREAEFTKFVDNSWHAVKVAYANEIGRVCLQLGISARQVHEIFISDTKLNISPYYTRPGGAFGGSCLPKDVRALQYIAADVGANTHLIDSLLRSNEAHKHRLYEYAIEGLEPGAKILLVGLAFKAGTDDLRESPNVDLARKLLSAGFDLDIYDPVIEADKLVGANLGYAFSRLPILERILVTKDVVHATKYARIITANATSDTLDLAAGIPVHDLATLP